MTVAAIEDLRSHTVRSARCPGWRVCSSRIPFTNTIVYVTRAEKRPHVTRSTIFFRYKSEKFPCRIRFRFASVVILLIRNRLRHSWHYGATRQAYLALDLILTEPEEISEAVASRLVWRCPRLIFSLPSDSPWWRGSRLLLKPKTESLNRGSNGVYEQRPFHDVAIKAAAGMTIPHSEDEIVAIRTQVLGAWDSETRAGMLKGKGHVAVPLNAQTESRPVLKLLC